MIGISPSGPYTPRVPRMTWSLVLWMASVGTVPSERGSGRRTSATAARSSAVPSALTRLITISPESPESRHRVLPAPCRFRSCSVRLEEFAIRVVISAAFCETANRTVLQRYGVARLQAEARIFSAAGAPGRSGTGVGVPAEIDGQVHIPGTVRLEQADTDAGGILQQGDRTGLVLGVYHSLHGVRQGGVGVTGRFGHQVQLMTLPVVGGTVVEQGGWRRRSARRRSIAPL